MLSLLKADLKRRHNKPGNVFLGLVHRLDRPVGGVMVFAKTSKAASRLSEQMRAGHLGKRYLARVRGCPDPREGELEHFLLKDSTTNTVRVVEEGASGAKRALLRYRVVESDADSNIVEIDLLTGRPHQIRVQFAAIGCPLVGDRKYGASSGEETDLALWSHEVRFNHPTRDEQLAFSAPPPWV